MLQHQRRHGQAELRARAQPHMFGSCPLYLELEWRHASAISQQDSLYLAREPQDALKQRARMRLPLRFCDGWSSR